MTRTSLDDLVVPDTAAATAALGIATAHHTPALLHHSLRVYLWAVADATVRGIDFDPELLYVAAMFHDIGLAPAFDSHTMDFAEAGGHVARVFAAGAGWSPGRRERLAEVIVRHMWPRVDVDLDAEGHLLARSTALDVAGRDLDDWTPGLRSEVLARHPRLGLAQEFLACFRAQADRKPGSTAAAAVGSGLGTRIAANPLDAG